MATSSLLYAAVCLASLRPSAMLPPLPGELVRSLSASKRPTVILLPAELGPNEVGPINELPVPVEIWSVLGKPQLTLIRERTANNRKMDVIVPWSTQRQIRDILESLRSDIFSYSLARFIFMLGEEAAPPYETYPEVSCIVVVLRNTVADVPWDGYRNCARRRTTTLADLFKEDPARTWSSLKGRSFDVVTRYSIKTAASSHHYAMIPESVTLLKSLRQLNVTVNAREPVGTGTEYGLLIRVIQRKEADLSLLPSSLSEKDNAIVHLGAVNGFRKLAFYSRKSTIVVPGLLQSLSSSLLTFAAIFFCALLVTGTHILQVTVARRRTSCHQMVLFLLSNVLGKGYAIPVPSTTATTRVLCLFWAFATVSLCAYLQSVFTSEMSVPAASRLIKSMDDLKKYAEAGKILPCIEENSYMHRFIAFSTKGVGYTLNRLLRKCPGTCVNTKDRLHCFALTKKGTHVYLRLYDPVMSTTHELFGLAPGTDFFRYNPSAIPSPKSFPYNHALRHFVHTLAETGAVHRQQREMLRVLRAKQPLPAPDPAVPVSFWDHFVIYACGNLVAFFFFLLEIVCKSLLYPGIARTCLLRSTSQ